MSHLRLVPPLAEQDTVTAPSTVVGTSPAPAAAVPVQRPPLDDENVAYAFFQAAAGICLCRKCSRERHPAYGAR